MSMTLSPTGALWTWNIQAGHAPVVSGYSTVPSGGGSGFYTKTGLTPADLRTYAVIPIQVYTTPPTPIPDSTLLQWIRWAEDEVEQDSGVKLCQTWIAAQPADTSMSANAMNLQPVSGGYQQLGLDYDFYEPAYDFFFPRAQDEGWLYQKLRWKPVQRVNYTDPSGVAATMIKTGVRDISFFYPLLNAFFGVPPSWFVEDSTRGLIRLVPSTSVQMLPLYALQLATLGFAQNVPGGLWIQYTAGLTANDYNSQWSFVRQLVLARALAIGFGLIQSSLNFGALETQITVDGLSYKTRWSERGPFYAFIKNQQETDAKLMKALKSKVAGPVIGML